MKKYKKLTAILLAMVMLLAMAIPALAATEAVPSNQVHVIVTHDCTVTYNFPEDPTESYYEWAILGTPEENGLVVYDAGYVNIDKVPLSVKQAYLKGVYEDPLPGVVSYLDVIVAALGIDNADYGWDATPKAGEPGGYISDYDNMAESWDSEQVDGDLWWVSGMGFVVAMGDAATDDISFPTEYLSNIPAEGGITLYVDCGYYELYTYLN